MSRAERIVIIKPPYSPNACQQSISPVLKRINETGVISFKRWGWALIFESPKRIRAAAIKKIAMETDAKTALHFKENIKKPKWKI